MEKTFLTLEKGDKVFYINIENSILKGGCEIKAADIVSIVKESPDSYNLTIELNNDDKIVVNHNMSLATIDKESKFKTDPLLENIVKPIDISVYSTNIGDLERYTKSLISNNIMQLHHFQSVIQREIVKLAGLQTLAGLMKYKAPAEVTTEAVIV